MCILNGFFGVVNLMTYGAIKPYARAPISAPRNVYTETKKGVVLPVYIILQGNVWNVLLEFFVHVPTWERTIPGHWKYEKVDKYEDKIWKYEKRISKIFQKNNYFLQLQPGSFHSQEWKDRVRSLKFLFVQIRKWRQAWSDRIGLEWRGGERETTLQTALKRNEHGWF